MVAHPEAIRSKHFGVIFQDQYWETPFRPSSPTTDRRWRRGRGRAFGVVRDGVEALLARAGQTRFSGWFHRWAWAVGTVPSGAEARSFIGPFAAPFGCAQGGLLKSCPFKAGFVRPVQCTSGASFRPYGAGGFAWQAFPRLRPPRRTPSGAILVPALREEMRDLPVCGESMNQLCRENFFLRLPRTPRRRTVSRLNRNRDELAECVPGPVK